MIHRSVDPTADVSVFGDAADFEDDDEGGGEATEIAPPPPAVSTPAGTGNVEAERSVHVLKGVRKATPADGLLSVAELEALYRPGQSSPAVFSAYAAATASLLPLEVASNTFGARSPLPLEGALQPSDGKVITSSSLLDLYRDEIGAHEPMWTSFTPLWRLSLDYIFVLPPSEGAVTVTGLLKTFKAVDLEPGLPRIGKSASDHISLMAELQF